jgi:hypothetical protein
VQLCADRAEPLDELQLDEVVHVLRGRGSRRRVAFACCSI